MRMAPDLTVMEAAELLLQLVRLDVGGDGLEAAIGALRLVPNDGKDQYQGYCVRCRGIFSHRDDCPFIDV